MYFMEENDGEHFHQESATQKMKSLYTKVTSDFGKLLREIHMDFAAGKTGCVFKRWLSSFPFWGRQGKRALG